LKIDNLDHLGLVAVIIDEMGLVEMSRTRFCPLIRAIHLLSQDTARQISNLSEERVNHLPHGTAVLPLLSP